MADEPRAKGTTGRRSPGRSSKNGRGPPYLVCRVHRVPVRRLWSPAQTPPPAHMRLQFSFPVVAAVAAAAAAVPANQRVPDFTGLGSLAVGAGASQQTGLRAEVSGSLVVAARAGTGKERRGPVRQLRVRPAAVGAVSRSIGTAEIR